MRRLTGLVIGAALLTTEPISAQEIHIDITGSQFEVLGPETFRIRNLTAPGFPGQYWVDLQWNPTTYKFEPTTSGTETPPADAVFMPGIAHCQNVGQFPHICGVMEVLHERIEPAQNGEWCRVSLQLRNKTTQRRLVGVHYEVFVHGGNQINTVLVAGQFDGGQTQTLTDTMSRNTSPHNVRCDEIERLEVSVMSAFAF